MRCTRWAAMTSRSNAYDRAIELAPDFAGGPYNRGIVLHALGRLDEAIAAYSWACAIDPGFLQALFNLGVAQSQRGRHDDAVATYERILALDPVYPHALGNVVHENAQLCAWKGREALVSRILREVSQGRPVVVPHPLLAMTHDAALHLAGARSLVALHHPPSGHPRWTGEMYKHDKIRIAYLSADFHEHAVAFLTAGLFEQHDHDRFEITGIVFGLDNKSAMRETDREDLRPSGGRAQHARRRSGGPDARTGNRHRGRPHGIYEVVANEHLCPTRGAGPGQLLGLSGNDGRRIHRLHHCGPVCDSGSDAKALLGTRCLSSGHVSSHRRKPAHR